MSVKQGLTQMTLTVLSISNKEEKVKLSYYSNLQTEPAISDQLDLNSQEMTPAERAQVIRLLESVLTNLL
jgi:hypothetical protein